MGIHTGSAIYYSFAVCYFGFNGWAQDGKGLCYYEHGKKLTGVQLIDYEGKQNKYILIRQELWLLAGFLIMEAFIIRIKLMVYILESENR